MRDRVLVLGASRADSASTDAQLSDLVARERALADLVQVRSRAVRTLAGERKRSGRREASSESVAEYSELVAAQATAEVLERTGTAQLALLRAAIQARRVGNAQAFDALTRAFNRLSQLGQEAPARIDAARTRTMRPFGRLRLGLGRSIGASMGDLSSFSSSDICPGGQPCDLTPGPRPPSARERSLYQFALQYAAALPWGLGPSTYSNLQVGNLDFQRYRSPDGALWSKYMRGGQIVLEKTREAFNTQAFEEAYAYVTGAVQTTVQVAQDIVNAACEIASNAAVQQAASTVGGAAVGAVATANAATCSRATSSSSGAGAGAAATEEKGGFSLALAVPIGLLLWAVAA